MYFGQFCKAGMSNVNSKKPNRKGKVPKIVTLNTDHFLYEISVYSLEIHLSSACLIQTMKQELKLTSQLELSSFQCYPA